MAMAINQTLPAIVSPERAKLQRAARDFESILISDLLKTAPRSGMLDGDGSESVGLEGYDDLRTEAMASALAAQGGIGIARMLMHQLGDANRRK
jgi:Rod binding domain-containing protein